MKDDNKHFENIWCSAETISSKLHQEPTPELLNSIKTLLDDYTGIEASNLPNEIKTSLKARHMGEIVFLLTAISSRDNINVWVSLENELKLNV